MYTAAQFDALDDPSLQDIRAQLKDVLLSMQDSDKLVAELNTWSDCFLNDHWNATFDVEEIASLISSLI